MTETRLLTAGDAPELERFLALHRDSSMFLRANARRAGLSYRGAPGEANYAGMFEKDRLVGVVAHCWNGMVLPQAPGHVAELARAVVEWSGRAVTGFSGSLEQVRQARSALSLDGAEAVLDGAEALYALDLAHLVVPASVTSGALSCRLPLPEERELLCAWRFAYNVEALNAPASPATRQSSAAFLDAQIAEGHAWVAVLDKVPVSLSAFNAVLPDIVQLGGIYTPPELRGRGFARVVIAASLVSMRERGAARSVLFTNNPSAIRTYEALGFRPIGDYALVLFR
jgi:ribosomal protein S18 acetylase RimI-like enzyme